MGPLTFAACGAFVVYRARHELTDAQVDQLAASLWDERLAAQQAQDGRTYINATRLADELHEAVLKTRQWRRCAGQRSAPSGALVAVIEAANKLANRQVANLSGRA